MEFIQLFLRNKKVLVTYCNKHFLTYCCVDCSSKEDSACDDSSLELSSNVLDSSSVLVSAWVDVST